MVPGTSYTLSDVAQRLAVAQHRLIHLCEKGVVTPDRQDATGRGSSRLFSPRNVLEFGVALRLREMMLPVAAVRAIVRVLGAFEARVKREFAGFSLPDSLRAEAAPDLRIVVSDGRSIYFSLARSGEDQKLFGGIPLDSVSGDGADWDGKVSGTRRRGKGRSRDGGAGFGGPERSRFARLELNVTEIARDLPLD